VQVTVTCTPVTALGKYIQFKHYLHFEEYSNRLESLAKYIEIESRGFKPQNGQFFFFLFFFLTLFMYLSDPLWKKKGFDLNYIIIVRIYLLNNAKIYSKCDTRYFQSLTRAPLG
jgi:hypothetical protein